MMNSNRTRCYRYTLTQERVGVTYCIHAALADSGYVVVTARADGRPEHQLQAHLSDLALRLDWLLEDMGYPVHSRRQTAQRLHVALYDMRDAACQRDLLVA